MKRIDKSQLELVQMYPVLDDPNTAEKLEEIELLHEPAKRHRKLTGEVKAIIGGHVLSLSEQDQKAGYLRVGEFLVPFTVEMTKESDVSFTRGGKTTAKLKLAPEAKSDDGDGGDDGEGDDE